MFCEIGTGSRYGILPADAVSGKKRSEEKSGEEKSWVREFFYLVYEAFRNPDLVRAGSYSCMYGVPVSEGLSLLFIYAKTYIDAALQSGSIDIYDGDAGILSFLTLQNAGNRSRDENVFYAYISGGNDYDRDRRCRDDRYGNRNRRLEDVVRHFQLAFIFIRSLFSDVVCCIPAFAACENRKDSDLLQCHVFFCISDALVAGCVLSGML